MKRLSPSDAMFLYGESREQMFHVAAMMPFTPPPDASPDHLRELMDEVRAGVNVYRPWNLKLKHPDFLYHPLQSWIEEPNIDLEYHLRRSALPSPGDERELGILVSRLHGYHIDFHRPPWEVHLIEGLEGGRFALFVKVHHSLVDGFTAMRILANALTTDPDERGRPLFFSIPPKSRAPREEQEGVHYAAVMSAVREQYGAAKVAGRALKRVFDSARSGAHELVSPRQAPKSILNARISQSRRFATQRLETSRLKAIAKAANGTLNDVVLALCAGSLRKYLVEQNALPPEPLIAMVPVAVRAKDEDGGGNSIGAILANLATDIEDPYERLAEIIESTRNAKKQLEGMSKAAIIQYSALLIAPSMLQMIPQTAGHVRPTFNVVISNVPGPEQPLYFRGARLEASYPMSIPLHGQALNITCNSYAGHMCFGFTGCRDTLPSLQHLAVFCGEALVELERAVATNAA
ncbi:MAG: wax ester/triacylglycerol synthase family O-acyltransferase [Kofleriaceae bacterium]|nr:wax ester/triacylglycerol synthase family O-acyltransferase [Kofleriaceae bacterium]